jgi:type 1 glutamine amidotransferase
MAGKRILLVLGGTWHDFEGFEAAMTPVLEAAGHSVEPTYDLEALAHLDEGRHDLVLMYTCIGVAGEDGAEPALPTDAQVDGLVEWVRGGGAFLASHASTVLGMVNQKLAALMGGVFVVHPEPFSFMVYPCYHEHPITAGVDAFSVHDEFYIEKHDESADVHMVALDRGVAYPMVWTRSEGKGRVAHIAMGHTLAVWGLEPYRRLTLQAIDWLTG